MSTFMKNIFSCDVASLPDQVFLHKYALNWRKIVPSLAAYDKCYRHSATLTDCPKFIYRICGRRFGDPRTLTNQKICKKYLWNKQLDVVTKGRKRMFDIYTMCIEKDIEKIQRCVPILEEACMGCEVRAMKTVRGTMDEAETLLNSDPNFRLLHLYRDPRAVYRSRHVQSWTWSSYETKSEMPWTTAAVYCQTVLHDYHKRKQLEEKFPGRIKSIVYDNFMVDPERARREVFVFLGMPVTPIRNMTKAESMAKIQQKEINPKQISSQKWESELTPDSVREVEEACQKFADAVGAKWR